MRPADRLKTLPTTYSTVHVTITLDIKCLILFQDSVAQHYTPCYTETAILTNEQNKSSMKAVQEFIRQSGRFQNPITNYDQFYFLFKFTMYNYFGFKLASSMRLIRANFFILHSHTKIAKFSLSPPPPPPHRLSPAPPTLFHYYCIGYLNMHVCFHSFFTCYTYCIVPNYLVNVLS